MQTAGSFFNIEQLEDKVILSPLRNLGEFAIESRLTDAHDPLLGIAEHVADSDVIVDFADTTYFGSTAIEFFNRLVEKVVGNGHQIAFCNFSEVERDIVSVTRLDQRWPIFKSLDEAVAHLKMNHEGGADQSGPPRKPR